MKLIVLPALLALAAGAAHADLSRLTVHGTVANPLGSDQFTTGEAWTLEIDYTLGEWTESRSRDSFTGMGLDEYRVFAGARLIIGDRVFDFGTTELGYGSTFDNNLPWALWGYTMDDPEWGTVINEGPLNCPVSGLSGTAFLFPTDPADLPPDFFLLFFGLNGAAIETYITDWSYSTPVGARVPTPGAAAIVVLSPLLARRRR